MPSADDLPYLDFSIVSPLPGADGRPLAVPSSWVPFPSVGEERLYVSPSVDEGALPARFIQPLVCPPQGPAVTGGGLHRGEQPCVDARALHPLAAPRRAASRHRHSSNPSWASHARAALVEALLRALGLDLPHRAATRLGWTPSGADTRGGDRH